MLQRNLRGCESRVAVVSSQTMEAYQPRHWVRCVTACNNRCLFCLDADTPRDRILSMEELKKDIDRGLEGRGATRLVLSGGEPTLHPKFAELVRYGISRGYERVQCITNGHRFADRAYLSRCLDAGLGEITFSLHGHTAELHDELTQTPGSFARLIQGLGRAVRDGRPVVNIDVCLNRQNIAHLEQIVELGISVGVTEFDLLHVIPQAAAFENRTRLFYDVREHLPTLQRVLQLNRHPRFHLWTNRLPATHLEGFEEHIQSPRKLADELAGRHLQVQAYLDDGIPLACRDPQRCPHCFLEPFCTTLDRVLNRLHSGRWQVWWIGEDTPPAPDVALPFGCRTLGRRVVSLTDVLRSHTPRSRPLYLEIQRDAAAPLPTPGPPDEAPAITLVAREPAQLEAWLDHTGARLSLEVQLNRRTAAWLTAHRDRLADHLESVRLHAAAFATLAEARSQLVQQPTQFMEALDLPIRCSGLPPCLIPGARLITPTSVLPRGLFDAQGQGLVADALLRYHLLHGYHVKSARCGDCVVSSRCAGMHINAARDLGLGLLKPLKLPAADTTDGEHGWAAVALDRLRELWPAPPNTVGRGSPPVPRLAPPFHLP